MVALATRNRTIPYFSLIDDLGLVRLDLSAVGFDEVSAGLRGRVARFALIDHLQCCCTPGMFRIHEFQHLVYAGLNVLAAAGNIYCHAVVGDVLA